ncbi:hypothetical protein APHAL10511_000001, partial [Amanita phalloides]
MTYKATIEHVEEEEEMERLQWRLVALQTKKRTVLDRVEILVRSKGNPTKEASTSVEHMEEIVSPEVEKAQAPTHL